MRGPGPIFFALALALALALPLSAQAQPQRQPASGSASGSASADRSGVALTFERAVAMAVARDERARIADEELEVAEAQVDRARAFFFPDVTASGGYRFRRDPGMFQERNVLTGQLSVGLTLFDGRGIPLLRAARRLRDASRLDRLEVRRQLAIDAASAYLSTLGAQAVVEAARSRVGFARESESDARGRVEAQLASANDATRARLELATALRELRSAEGDLATSRLHLGWLIGAEVGALAEPEALLAAAAAPGATAPGGPATAAPAPATAGERLDVRAARLRVESARALAEEPLWRWAPSLSLVGQADWSSVANFTGKSTDWFIGVNALWTLWDGGERGADRAARLAEARAAGLQVDRQLREVNLEEETALVALATARSATAEAQAAVDAARQNVEEARILYREGLARALEVADASARLFDAEVALARERFGLGVALIELRAARGLDPLGAQPGSQP